MDTHAKDGRVESWQGVRASAVDEDTRSIRVASENRDDALHIKGLTVLFQDGLDVGRGKATAGKREGDGLARVGNKDDVEFGVQWWCKELGEDSLADTTDTDECDWNRADSSHFKDVRSELSNVELGG